MSVDQSSEVNMHWTDLIGCVASALVLLTFYMNDMTTLRTAALCSNVVFIVYAASLQLMPILLLHSILIPINLWRLVAALCANDRYGAAEPTLEGSIAGGSRPPFPRWADDDRTAHRHLAAHQRPTPPSQSFPHEKR